MAVKSAGAKVTPEGQLNSLIETFDPKTQEIIRSLRSALRKRLPSANELVYDYGFSLVIAYSPTEQGIEGILTTSARDDDGVSLYFTHGPELPDPKKLLMGSAKLVRFIPVEAASRLKHPDVEALIAAAIDKATVPVASEGAGKLVIKTFGKRLAKPKVKAKAKAKSKPAKRKPASAKSKK